MITPKSSLFILFLVGFLGSMANTSKDSLKVFADVERCRLYLKVDLDSALFFIKKAENELKNISSPYLEALISDVNAVVVEKKGDWTEAVQGFKRAIDIRLQGHWHSEAGQSYLHLGNLYYREGEMHELSSRFDLADSSFILALRAYQHGLEQEILAADSLWMAHSFLNIGAVNYKLFRDREALRNYKSAMLIFEKTNQYSFVTDVWSNMALVYKNRGEIDSASYYFKSARESYKFSENIKNWISANLNLSSLYFYDAPLQSITYLMEADSLSIHLGGVVQQAQVYEQLYRLHDSLGNLEKALLYLQNYISIKDSLLTKDFKSEELSVRYESGRQKELIEKQRNENLRKELALSKSKSEKQILWVGLTIALVSVGSLLALGWYKKRVRFVIQKQREKISAQKIDQLKKEQAVKTIEALLQGQEKERGRISEDLHDRLGSTLSAVRMQIEAYGESVDTSDSESVKKLLALVDRAIEETRSISHNLISGVLARFGLEAALKELQENFNVSQRVKVHLKIGELNSMESEFEVVVFRIVQEILNNALRHSDAENIWIDVGMRGDTLRLEIKDDGSGFDLEQKSTGMGLKNINTRVTRLEGNLNIASHLGGGTCFKIQIPLKNETSKYLNC
ncbi:signal transduction histidine kinase [Owenweeksia hongkongensis DSM 17368]|uniref:Oxygen sensor histidine kinase NreB n=1 Tax=Owenweeksia hongkongensis (strain DSM 17368 / CIP 108786 / JCM 12287 / NRRL B-23963 / UST20020801) TaxID=926562 RepID=G8R4B3_OWEHD|nr:sensor histidine kinase [Owenweeksia hongkongensis]AEV34213.1 signal transduction histidine kinase [Owenweeksia hongkongensis DSM 17368]